MKKYILISIYGIYVSMLYNNSAMSCPCSSVSQENKPFFEQQKEINTQASETDENSDSTQAEPS